MKTITFLLAIGLVSSAYAGEVPNAYNTLSRCEKEIKVLAPAVGKNCATLVKYFHQYEALMQAEDARAYSCDREHARKVIRDIKQLWARGVQTGSLAAMCSDGDSRTTLALTGFDCSGVKDSARVEPDVSVGERDIADWCAQMGAYRSHMNPPLPSLSMRLRAAVETIEVLVENAPQKSR